MTLTQTDNKLDLIVRLLGPVQVIQGGQPLTILNTKGLALLVYLAEESSEPQARSLLANLLWPDQAESAALHNLRQTLTTLRRTILDHQAQPPFLFITRQSLQLNRQSNIWLDTVQFARRQIYTHPPLTQESVAALEQAVELYRGDFLTGLTIGDSDVFENWLVTRREYYRRSTTEILDQLATYYEAQHAYEQSIKFARRLVELAPWQESAHRTIMRNLAASGHRGEALAYYQTCCQILEAELEVEPSFETTTLFEQIRAGEWPTDSLESRATLVLNRKVWRETTHHLPAHLTSFVGREPELAKLADYLAKPTCRLITIGGPGGVGKTRLALAAAERNRHLFRDGVHFVPLNAIESAELVAPAIGAVLQLSFADHESPQEQLRSYLRPRQLLLVLDNFEQLIDGTNLLLELLQYAPDLKLLIASRERLNLQAEWLVEIAGLPYPTGGLVHTGAEDQARLVDRYLNQYAALSLLVQRAQQVSPVLTLDHENLNSFVRICQLSEGLPLALELAAAQTRQHTIAEIVTNVESNLDRLTARNRDRSNRHRSMRALFDSTWERLSQGERILFQQLAVFVGGFDREAAQNVAGATQDNLASLVDKSILRRSSANRYELHQLLRQYGLEKLRCNLKEFHATRNRHGSYFADLLYWRAPKLELGTKPELLNELEQDLENIRAAWHWAINNEKVDDIKRAREGLFRLLKLRNWLLDGVQLFKHAVQQLIGDLHVNDRDAALLESDAVSIALPVGLSLNEAIDLSKLKAELLLNLAYFTELTGDYSTMLAAAQEALKLTLRTQDPDNEIRAYLMWGRALWRKGRHKSAQALFIQALTLAGNINHTHYRAQSLQELGNLYQHRGEQSVARRHLKQALIIYQAEKNFEEEARTLNQLGGIHSSRGNYTRARTYLERAAKIYNQAGDQHLLQEPLRGLALILQRLGLYSEAQDHFKQVMSTAQEFGNRHITSLTLRDLGLNSWYLGDSHAAERHLREALEVNREIRNLAGEGYSLTRLGRVLADGGQLQEAADAYRRALYVRRKVGQSALAIVDLAGLAGVTMRQDRPAQALAEIDEVLRWVEANDTRYLEDLPWVYWQCYRVLNAAVENPELKLRKLGTLDAAYSILQERAEQIDDSQLRRNYLENVVIHRQIVAAWKTMYANLS
ncbi:MAG TPA: tetratricopeptide repeat protein [Anaerolineae bacterium]|nr:tetratricopeptide repeat protein [Anaerolineae bacterium]